MYRGIHTHTQGGKLRIHELHKIVTHIHYYGVAGRIE